LDIPPPDADAPANAPVPQEDPTDLSMPFAPEPGDVHTLLRRNYKPPRRLWRAFLISFLGVTVLFGAVGYYLYRIPVDQWGDAVRFSDHLEIYHGEGVSAEEATALGNFVLARGMGTPAHPVTLRLARKEDGYTLYVFTSSLAVLTDESAVEEMRKFRDEISRDVLSGQRITLRVCSQQVFKNGLGALSEPEVLKVIE
jgi:hypothetical protein